MQSISRRDFDDLARIKQAREKEAQAQNLRSFVAAATPAELVTGYKEWDAYLNLLQGAIEQTEKVKANLSVQMEAPELTDAVQLLRVKVELIRCSERITAWQAAMRLPKDLIEGKAHAESLLEELIEGASSNDD